MAQCVVSISNDHESIRYQRNMENSLKLLDFLNTGQVEEFEKIIERDENIDVNYFYEEPDNGTLLDIACRSSGNSKFVQILLQHNADPNLKNRQTERYPIHEAVLHADMETLTFLTGHKNHEAINFHDEDGHTPLHLVIYKKSGNIEIMKILLQNRCPPIDVNAKSSNNISVTPLRLAFWFSHAKAAAGLLLKCPDIDLDRDICDSGYTNRNFIRQKYPRLLEQLLEQPHSKNSEDFLWLLLHNRETEKFEEAVQNFDTEQLKDILQYACSEGLTEFVDILLEKGVDTNIESKEWPENSSILTSAAYEGNYEIFGRLLNEPAIFSDNSVEHVLVSIFRGMIEHQEKNHDHKKILEFMFNEVIPYQELNFNGEGLPFAFATILNDDQVTKALFYTAAYHYIPTEPNHFGYIPWDQFNDTVLEDCLDDCISSIEHRYDPKNLHFIFNYTLLIKSKQNYEQNGHEMSALFAMAEVPHLRKLFEHPILKSFIHLKWCLVKKYYYINFVNYLLFCVALYICIISTFNQKFSSSMNNNSTINNTNSYYETSSTPMIIGSKIITSVLLLAVIFRELLQFCFSPWPYLKSLENWLEITMIFMTGVFILTDSSPVAVYAILTSSMELVLILGKHPICSTYIEIFKAVALNFLKFSAIYSALIISFAFSFYILFHNPSIADAISKNVTNFGSENSINSWQTPMISILKTIIMLTGELGADSIPFDSTLSNSHFVFILFVFLITIVLYNLINGLAVSDTRAITEDAEFVVLKSRLKLISELELLSHSDPCARCCNTSQNCFVLLLKNTKKRLGEYFQRVYGEKIKLFPDELSCAAIMVLPETGEVRLLSEIPDHVDKTKPYPGKLFSWKMPSSIIEQARRIEQNRQVFSKLVGNECSMRKNAMRERPPKFQSVDKLGQTFMSQIRELELKIDEKNCNLDKKLIPYISSLEAKMKQHISTLETNMEKRISSLETIMENRISSLEPIMENRISLSLLSRRRYAQKFTVRKKKRSKNRISTPL